MGVLERPGAKDTRTGLLEPKTMSTNDTRTQEGTDSQATFIVAGDEGEILEDPRPDDCQCSPLFDDLACWPCYNAGFEEPNPNLEE